MRTKQSKLERSDRAQDRRDKAQREQARQAALKAPAPPKVEWRYSAKTGRYEPVETR